jgi:hypothetical protein
MNCDKGVFAKLGRLNGACLQRIRGELAIGRGSRAAHLYAVGPFGS